MQVCSISPGTKQNTAYVSSGLAELAKDLLEWTNVAKTEKAPIGLITQIHNKAMKIFGMSNEMLRTGIMSNATWQAVENIKNSIPKMQEFQSDKLKVYTLELERKLQSDAYTVNFRELNVWLPPTK